MHKAQLQMMLELLVHHAVTGLNSDERASIVSMPYRHKIVINMDEDSDTAIRHVDKSNDINVCTKLFIKF